MKFTLRRLLELNRALNLLANMPLEDAVLSYRVGKMRRRLEKEETDYLKESNRLICEVYGVPDPKPDAPGNFKLLPENTKAYSDQIEKLLDEESTYEFPALTFTMLKGLKLPPQFYSLMDDYITEGPEDVDAAPKIKSNGKVVPLKQT